MIEQFRMSGVITQEGHHGCHQQDFLFEVGIQNDVVHLGILVTTQASKQETPLVTFLATIPTCVIRVHKKRNNHHRVFHSSITSQWVWHSVISEYSCDTTYHNNKDTYICKHAYINETSM